jgi:hypothetical protein
MCVLHRAREVFCSGNHIFVMKLHTLNYFACIKRLEEG